MFMCIRLCLCTCFIIQKPHDVDPDLPETTHAHIIWGFDYEFTNYNFEKDLNEQQQ